MVSAFSQPPFLVISEDHTKLLGCVALDMFNTLAEHFNFDWQSIVADNWVVFHPNGSFGGSLGEVMSGNVDLSLEQPAYGQWGTCTHYPYAHHRCAKVSGCYLTPPPQASENQPPPPGKILMYCYPPPRQKFSPPKAAKIFLKVYKLAF